MKRTLKFFALGLLLALTATAAFAKGNAAGDKKDAGDVTATLEAKERQMQEWIKNKDAASFLAVLDKGAWMADPSGFNEAASTVPELMKMIEMKSYTIENYKTMTIDKDACVATYVFKGDATMGGQPYPPGPWYCSTVWAKRGKDWKAVYHQETLAMQPPSSMTESH